MNLIVNILMDIINIGLEKVGLYYSSYRGIVADNEDPFTLEQG